jgi:VIT1/CCC1 family predicted Fe2+/Mn2+ transporter
MSDQSILRPRRVLDPLDRLSEILFGLIMVMTFTGSISVAESGQGQIRDVLLSALGCNLAWGLIDGGMYIMARFTERARGLLTLKAIRTASNPDEAHRLIAESLPADIFARLGALELERIRGWLNERPEPQDRVPFTVADFMGALAVFLLVFLSTFPVVIPFLVMHEAAPALRVSHSISVVMLFLVGWSIGTHTGRPGWQVGAVMVLVGTALAAITLALGG